MTVRTPSMRVAFSLVSLALLSLAFVVSHLRADERINLNFDPDWKFIKSDPAGAQAVDFNDHDWNVVSAPHTYNDVDTFDDWSLPGHRGQQDQWSGPPWCRKTFTPSHAYEGQKGYIEVRGVAYHAPTPQWSCSPPRSSE